VFQPKTVRDVVKGLLMLGELTNRKRQVQKLAEQLERRLNAVAKRVANKPKVSVVVEISPPPSLMVAGPGTFIDDAIRIAGGKNAFSDAQQPFPLISLETLVAKDPDVYIIATKGKTSSQVLDEVRKRSGFSNLRCVRDGEFTGLIPDLLFRPTPRLIEGVEKLASFCIKSDFSHPVQVPGMKLSSGLKDATKAAISFAAFSKSLSATISTANACSGWEC
jgi:iron complex transport system substrate-binding protein